MGEEGTGDGESLAARLDGASNILLAGPTFGAAETSACMELLDVAAPEALNVLAVTYNRSPGDWVSHFRSHVDGPPEFLRIISVNDSARSVAAPASAAPDPGQGLVESVESAHDLTGLGIRINEYLRHVEDAKWDAGGPETVVCFDSLTALLQFVDVRQAFRFLHIVTKQIASVGATAHYHVHPDALDDSAMQTLQTLFDGRVTLGDEGVEDIDVQ